MQTQQRNLVLILTRELASNSATPMFLVDPEGTLVFFNEPAERVLGRSFAETGALTPPEWGKMFAPVDENGGQISTEKLPLVNAIRNLEPGHLSFHITGLDGNPHKIAVTAFPLFARANELLGALAIFWEESRDERA
ncbi:MAG: PAS domain-containing protein [Actinomycetota bacterium]